MPAKKHLTVKEALDSYREVARKIGTSSEKKTKEEKSKLVEAVSTESMDQEETDISLSRLKALCTLASFYPEAIKHKENLSYLKRTYAKIKRIITPYSNITTITHIPVKLNSGDREKMNDIFLSLEKRTTEVPKALVPIYESYTSFASKIANKGEYK